MHTHRHLCFASLLTLAACSGQSGGESPAPGGADLAASCAQQSSSELALDQTAPIGFSGQDMLDLAGNNTTVTLRYSDASRTELMLGISTDSDVARYVERINESASASTDCASQLRVTVNISFGSSDGAFAETISADLVATQSTTTGFFLDIAVESLSGSFDFQRFDNRSYTERRVLIDALFDSDGPRGRLQILGRSNDAASANITEVGQWPPGD